MAFIDARVGDAHGFIIAVPSDEGSYLEALVHRITPYPEKFEIHLPNQSTFSFPYLVQFMNTAKNLTTFYVIELGLTCWPRVMIAAPLGS
jgi:hypothetical protein